MNLLQNPFLSVESLFVHFDDGDYQGEIATLFPNVRKLELSGSIPHNISIMSRKLTKLKSLSVFATSEFEHTQQYHDSEIGGLLQVTPTVSKLKLQEPVTTAHNTLDRLPQLKKLIINYELKDPFLMEPFFIEALALPNIQVFGLNAGLDNVLTEIVIESFNNSHVFLLEVDMGMLSDSTTIDVPLLLDQCHKIEGIALKASRFFEALQSDNLPKNILKSLRQNFFVQTEALGQPAPLSTMRKTDRKLLFKRVKPNFIDASFSR